MRQFAIKINGTIKEVIEAYNNKFVPMKELATDYLAVLSNKEELVKAVNPWAHLMKSKDIVHVRGVSVEETVFIHAAMKLKNQLPTDVIRAAFFRGVNNDLSFEFFFVIPEFMDNIGTTGDICLVNPSPDMILKVNSTCSNDKYYVEDRTIYLLYKKQFGDKIINDISRVSPGSNVLYTSRNTPKEKVINIIKGIIATRPAYCKMIIPVSILDDDREEFFHILSNHIYVNSISIIPTSATHSISRRKIMLDLTNNRKETIILNKYNDTDESLMKDNQVLIDYEDFKRSSITTNSIYENRGIKIKGGKYNVAEIVDYSLEIRVYINVLDNRHGMLSAVGYYKAIKDVDNKKYGSRISPKVEQGMRGKTREEVLNKALDLVYNTKIYKVIEEDIYKNYIRENKPVTLKTLLFLCCNDNNNDYLKSLLNEDGLEWLKNSYIREVNAEVMKDKLFEKINDINVVDTIILQLNQLMKTAIRKKLIDYNPFVTVSEIAKIRQQQKISSLRRVLVKKHIDDDREWELLGKSITEDIKTVENSLELSFLLRYFSGISIRELCSIKYKDFRRIGKHKSVMISRIIDDDGNEVINYENKINKLRLVPLPDYIGALIDKRVKWMHEKGLKLERILDMHLLMNDEKDFAADNLVKPAVFLRYNNKRLEELNISRNLIINPQTGKEIDLNKYHGDLIQTNYRYHLLNDCEFERNEINHVIGNVQQDTFSIHYCDFNAASIQLKMCRKLNRWICRIKGIENQSVLYFIANKHAKNISFDISTTCGAEVSIITVPKEQPNER